MTDDHGDDYLFTGCLGTPADQLVQRSCRRNQAADRLAASRVARGLDRTGVTRDQRRARAIRECGTRVHVCFDRAAPAKAAWPFVWRCDERLCPGCSRQRDLELLARRLPYLLDAPIRETELSDVTLTQRVWPWETVEHAASRLWERWRRLYRRAVFKRAVLGWMFAFHVTWTRERGFHLHAHGVLEVTPGFSAKRLETAWRSAGRGRTKVLVRPMKRSVLANWLAYMAEPDAIVDPDALRRLTRMRGRHGVSAGGSLHARRFPSLSRALAEEATERAVMTLSELEQRAAGGNAEAQEALTSVGKRAHRIQRALDRVSRSTDAAPVYLESREPR